MRNEQLIDLSSSSEQQVKQHVLNNIRQGVYADKALPSYRQMASMMRVSRQTVMSVYQSLVDEGVIYCQQKKGYFAKQSGDSTPLPSQYATQRAPSPAVQQQFWQQRFNTQHREHEKAYKPLNWRNYPYPFIGHRPAPSMFPFTQWRECERLAQKSGIARDWNSESIDTDDTQLIKQLQTQVLAKRGIHASNDEILLTIGNQNSLYLLANLLLSPNTTIGMEEPGYISARTIFAQHFAKLEPLALDTQGIALSPTLSQCDYIYTMPDNQIPTNITMTAKRKEALLEAAEQRDFVLIEDDHQSELNHLGHSANLKSLDKHGRVIYLGSLSKTLAPAMQMGYIVASKHVICELKKIRRMMYRHPSATSQRTCALFLSMGYYDNYLKKLRNSDKQKWSEMRRAIEQYLPYTVDYETIGGRSFWLRLPDHLDCSTLTSQAEKLGILVEPGDAYFSSQNPQSSRYIRLSYSAIDLEDIASGIQKLAKLIQSL
ncbi:aminotransferase-like domain-containing protein [Vibrio olivae]|uniref:PLP-dependent aminotransferase family protein n=1 Tax=Vibrio olivae TaxID=1243002 RepID=A0ABV5HQX7_9VIBR